MKKTIFMLLLFFLFLTVVKGQAGQNLNPGKGQLKNYQAHGFITFSRELLQRSVSVTLADVDVTIIGILTAVYEDGLVLKTPLKGKVFIARSSIAYIRANKKIKK